MYSFKVEVENLDIAVKTNSENDSDKITEVYENYVGLRRVEEFILEEVKKGLGKELEKELKKISDYLDGTFGDYWEYLW